MATTWMPMTRMERQRWLLSNGEIVTEPALEMTGTGRKVRVAGTTDSVYASELPGLLDRAADTLAAQRGTHVWMELPDDFAVLNRNIAGLSASDWNRAQLHLVHDPTNHTGKTVCYWRFKASDSPFEVLLVASMEAQGTSSQVVNVKIVVPFVRYNWERAARAYCVENERFSDLIEQSMSRHDNYYQWSEFVRDNPVEWPTDLFVHKTHTYARPAVNQFLTAVRAFEDLESIEVPDLSNPDAPAYVTLELYDTNVNAELLSDLAEYLDGAPTVEKVAEVYQELLNALRAVGINVGTKSENDFMAALLAGDNETLRMTVMGLAEEDGDVDRSHKLSVHLPTGTFIVECDHADVDPNHVAEKWEEAMTMASLTGDEDTLLAYAKAYAQDRIKKRTTKILKERTSTT